MHFKICFTSDAAGNRKKNLGKEYILLRLPRARGIGDVTEEKQTAADEGVQYE